MYLGKMAMVNQSLQDTINMMQSNILAILDQENQLKETMHKLDWMGATFKKNTKGIRRWMMMQKCQTWLIMGSVITTVAGICIIPLLLLLC